MPNVSPQDVIFWYDYSCPYCYMGLVRLETLQKETPFSVERKPYLLRPDSTLPIDNPKRHEPAIRRSHSTTLAHEATAYAKEHGLDAQFHHAAAQAYWQSGADLGSLYVLRDLAKVCGLDWETMGMLLESRYYNDSVIKEHEAAVKQGVAGTPSYLIQGRIYTGNVTLATLRTAVSEAG